MIIEAPHRGHVHVGRGRRTVSSRWRGCRLREQRAGEGQARGATGAGEIAEVADADEAARQDVLDEAPQKFHRGERHRAPAGRRARSPSSET